MGGFWCSVAAQSLSSCSCNLSSCCTSYHAPTLTHPLCKAHLQVIGGWSCNLRQKLEEAGIARRSAHCASSCAVTIRVQPSTHRAANNCVQQHIAHAVMGVCRNKILLLHMHSFVLINQAGLQDPCTFLEVSGKGQYLVLAKKQRPGHLLTQLHEITILHQQRNVANTETPSYSTDLNTGVLVAKENHKKQS